MKRILDSVFNLGHVDGLGGFRCIRTLALLDSLTELDPLFHPTEGCDLLAEYEDGWREGKYARDQSFLTEGGKDNVPKV